MSESSARSGHKKHKKHKKKKDRSLPWEYENRKLYMDEEEVGVKRRKTIDVIQKTSKSKRKYNDSDSGWSKEHMTEIQKNMFDHLEPKDKPKEHEKELPKRLKDKIDQSRHKSNMEFLQSHKITITNTNCDPDIKKTKKRHFEKPHKTSRSIEEVSSDASHEETDYTSKSFGKQENYRDRKKFKAVRRVRCRRESNSDYNQTSGSSSLRRVHGHGSSEEKEKTSRKRKRATTSTHETKLRTPPHSTQKEKDYSLSCSGSDEEDLSGNSSSRLYSDCISPNTDRSVLSRIKLEARSRHSIAGDNYEAKSENHYSDSRHSKSFHSETKRKRSFLDSSLDDSFLSTNKHRTGLFSRELKYGVYSNWEEEKLERARNSIVGKVTSNLPFVDTHCHIDFLFKKLPYAKSYDDYIDESFFRFPKNFEGCIADWCQPSLYKTAQPFLRGKSSKQCKIWAAFGCHPHFVNTYNDSVEKEIFNTIQNNDNVIAIGEMGLDYSDRFGRTDHELQKDIFVRQLKVAGKLQVPLVIHCRDADPDLIKIMKEYVPHDTKIHRHCLTTEERDVRELLEYFPNCFVGFTNLLSNKSAYRARSAASTIPLERILLETDSPYFIPRCVSEATNSAAKFSHSGMAICVAKEIASLKRISIEKVLKQTRKNVTSVYGI
uniref:Uncharacterized protein LOC100180529 n=1 Tax=Phallusia mammillata TaxID=59560 RepID=A0A6F9DHX4_9ASCI|nr:uncharacterized protein LOC100180529 [Phallusia mammillata]